MSRFFKSAAFPILIVVVLAFFAQKLISPGETKSPPSYGQFIEQLNAGQVRKVDMRTKDKVIAVTQTNGKKSETGFADDAAGQLGPQLQIARKPGKVEDYNVEP